MVFREPPKILFFALIIGSVVGALVFRLADLQILRGEVFSAQADHNRFFTERLPSERGIFFDRYGQPMVINLPEYYQIINAEALYGQQQPINYQDALGLMASSSAKVSYNLKRKYLYPEALAHTLGYVGAVTAEDLAENSNLRSTDMVGKLGLEKIFDEQLRGTSASRIYEINALGQKQRLLGENPQIPGLNIKTTLDPYLTKVAYDAMADQRGAVVIMDADTGAVLGLVSKPAFDANIMTASHLDEEAEKIRLAQVRQMIANPLQLFFNRAVGGSYPPGSVFKLVTAVAGLDSKVLTAQTEVIDQGTLEVGEYSFANWYYTQYGGVEGAISLERALARSNDIYFYKAAEWIGPTRLAETARLFGLGQKTGVSLSGEAGGLVPDPAWKEKTLGEPWYLGNTFHFGIGQDNLLVTPLQMASMTQVFAKQGSLCKPRLTELDPVECSELGFKEEDLQIILRGMLAACSSGGTAFPFFEHNATHRRSEVDPETNLNHGAIACKTGTAEFGATDEKGYKKTHGWFVSIIGVEAAMMANSESVAESAVMAATESAIPATRSAEPKTNTDLHQEWLANVKKTGFPSRLIVAILVESDERQPYKEGSREAAPVAKAILDWIYGH